MWKAKKQEDIEDYIYETMKQILDKDIDVSLTFWDIGLGSMQVYKLYHSLQECFPALIISDIFEYPTVESLAEHLMVSSADSANLDITKELWYE